MYLTVHALAGALIGKEINNIALAFLLGFISHFVLDKIPHQDPDNAEESLKGLGKKINQFSKKEKRFITIVIVDFLTFVFLVIMFYFRDIFFYLSPVIAGVIGGVLPDLLLGLYYLTGNKFLKKFKKLHHQLHYNHDSKIVSPAGGLITQLIALAVFIRIILH